MFSTKWNSYDQISNFPNFRNVRNTDFWDYFDDNSEAILSWRTALMGRLSELKVVNWEISKQQKDDKGNEIMKGGVSQYSLVE